MIILVVICLALVSMYFLIRNYNSKSLDSDGYAHDIVFVNQNHIIVAEWYGGVSVSKDGGNSWKHSETIPIQRLTVDNNGRIWGYHRWHGIHEPSHATLTYSDDDGLTWREIDLDPSIVMPEGFITSDGDSPIIIASNGQLWSYRSGERNDWSEWQKLGNPNPDSNAITGIKVEDTIYISCRDKIWLSNDLGNNWLSSPIQDVKAIANEGKDCWAITNSGTLHQSECGTTLWEEMITIPDIAIAFDILVKNGRILIASEHKDWKAYCPVVEKDLSVSSFDGLEGKQSYAVRTDPNGNVWCVAQGVFINKGKRWEKVWPKK